MATTRTRGTGPRQRGGRRGGTPQPEPQNQQSTGLAALLPLILAAALFGISFVSRVQENPALTRSFWAAAIGLLVFQAALALKLRRAGVTRQIEYMGGKKQHYIQALVQLSIFIYWGWYWRTVYDAAWLMLAQLIFAYAFDMVLAWWRREKYVLGFGPFPIIFSINLFLVFRDDWFYLQFLMIAVGLMGKEFVKWERNGRRVHIFNPSAFTLGLFSLILILTGGTAITWGPEIASTLTLAPRMYLWLFLSGLVVMYFFSITLVAASAAITLFLLSAVYMSATGVPYFIDSEIPAAVFLGLHLLITDPSTSPRTPPGKLIFGILYGLSVFVLYAVLDLFGAPTFYDKLLAVPILNLSVQWIDRMVVSIQPGPLLRRLHLDAFTPRGNLIHMAVWIVVFGAAAATGRTDGRHTGDSIPFWVQACEEGRRNGCERLLQIEASYCGDNSGWACNELGRHYAEGRITDPDPELAFAYFGRACELRFQPGCINMLEPERLASGNPRPLDLRLLLRERGLNLMEMPEPDLYVRACEHEWAFACERLAGAM